jgi:membrane protease YdiL (CAAX protease family)
MYHINRTLMIKKAQESLINEKKPQTLFTEAMIFILVAMIATLPQGFISTIGLFIIMFTDPTFWNLAAAETVDPDAIMEYSMQLTQNLPQWYFVALLASSGFMILAAIVYCKAFQKRDLYSIGFSKRGFALEYLVGALVGLVMISLPILVCHLTGALTITVSDSIDPLTLFLFFVAFMLQGMGEEALFRGYLMTSIARRHHIWVAILFNSLMFAAFHMGNASFGIIPFLNITLFGIFASVLMLKRGNIWAVGAIHSLWNFAQGNVFGLNVSGNPKFASVFSSAQGEVGAILSGGDFGPEGGLGVTVVLLVAILVSLMLKTKSCEQVEEAPEKIKIDFDANGANR